MYESLTVDEYELSVLCELAWDIRSATEISNQRPFNYSNIAIHIHSTTPKHPFTSH